MVLFAACKKYRKNTLGRTKSCRWQVFVRRRPPKQGELRTDVSKATMFQGDRKVSKGFNFVRGKVLFGCADSRFAEPRSSLQGKRLVTFCVVQKVTKKHAGLCPATSIQSSAGNNLGKTPDSTSRNRFFAQNGGEKALNRCEVRVLQRKDLEQR